MTLEQKAKEMRDAIDGIELALMGLGDRCGPTSFMELPRLFDGCPDDMQIIAHMSVGQMRQVCRAAEKCNRIINSPEYIPASLTV